MDDSNNTSIELIETRVVADMLASVLVATVGPIHENCNPGECPVAFALSRYAEVSPPAA